jgi:Flp pilus assembly protein TadB
MDQKDSNEGSKLDPRAVPVAVCSVLVIVLGICLTYANTTFGALVVLFGLFGVVWLVRILLKQPTRD